MKVIIPFARDVSRQPNAPDDVDAKQLAYWRCIEACVTSLRRHHSPDEVSAYLVTDCAVPPGTRQHLQSEGIDIVAKPFSFDPGASATTYRSSFYKLDALEAAVEMDDDVLIIDPDVLFIRPLDRLIAQVKKRDVLFYSIDPEEVGPRHFGLTCAEIEAAIPRELLPESHGHLRSFVGGEALAVRKDVAGPLLEQFRVLFETNVKKNQLFKTEEHIYTCIPALEWDSDLLNGLVCRSWTHMSAKETVSPTSTTVVVHLPAEKGVLFKILAQTRAWPAASELLRLAYFRAAFSRWIALRKAGRLAFSAFARLT
jgi:hypothetical protein